MAKYSVQGFKTNPNEDAGNGPFTIAGHLFTRTFTPKEAKIILSTETQVNTIRLDVFEKLVGVQKETTPDVLVPLQKPGDDKTVQPVGLARSVLWGTSATSTIYVADFYVVRDEQWPEVMIGSRTIEEYHLLASGSGKNDARDPQGSCVKTQPEWLEELRSLFAVHDLSMRPGFCDEFGQFDLKCSVKVITAPSNAQLFRMLASFQTHVNIVSDTVCRSLKLDKKPYHGEPISVLGRGDRIPTGTVELQWGFSRGEKLYRDVFHVVEGVGYDLLLKMPSKK